MAAKLQCEICGGKLIGRPGGFFECDSCGMEYDTAWAKEKIQEITGTVKVEGTVQVQGSVKIENPVTIDTSAKTENYLMLGGSALHDRQWDKAAEYYGHALELDATNAEAYLGRYMARKKYPGRYCVKSVELLSYWNNSDLHNSMKYAAGELKEWFSGLQAEANEERKIREEQAETKQQKAQNSAERFDAYKANLNNALKSDRASLEHALTFFDSNSGYAHCRDAAKLCREKLACGEGMVAAQKEIPAFEERLRSHQQLLNEYRTRHYELGIFGNRKEKTALSEQISAEETECNRITAEIEQLKMKLSSEPDTSVFDRDLRALFLQTQIDQLNSQSTIEFGSYYHNDMKKKIPIRWSLCTRRTKENITTVSLISAQILDCAPKGSTEGDWEGSGLRRWLQNDFFREAFSDVERKIVGEIRLLKNEEEIGYPNSFSMLGKYGIRMAVAPTTYAAKQGVQQSKANAGNGTWIKLVKLPSHRYGFKFHDAKGIERLRSEVQGGIGVRPVIEITFNKES